MHVTNQPGEESNILAMREPVIWQLNELIEATGGGRLISSVAPSHGYSSFTFPLPFLKPNSVLLHVHGRSWRERTISGCGQKGMSINSLLTYARRYQNVLVITDQEPDDTVDFPILLVDSTYDALFALATYQRNRFRGHVIGITGTSGKSSTRDMVVALLSKRGLTSSSVGNWNTTEGIALALANLVPEAEFAVVEISGGAIKGMRGLSALDMVHHHDAVITSIGINLTSRTPTARDVAEVKSKLFSHLPTGGKAYYAKDVAEVETLRKAAEGFEQRVIGDRGASSIQLRQIKVELDGSLLQLRLGDADVRVKASVIGPGQINNLALAVQLAIDLGVSLHDVTQTIAAFSLAKRKMEVSNITVGNTVVKLLDDCHNATQVSFENALGHLEQIKTSYSRSILIIGKIVHIEGQESKVYSELGERIAACEPSVVILFDEGLTLLKTKLDELQIPVLQAGSPLQVYELLRDLVTETSVVFLKGSHRGTHIRELSSLLRKGDGSMSGRTSAGILHSSWTQYELAYYIEALAYYDEVIFIDPSRVTYRIDAGSSRITVDYLGRSLDNLSIVYTLEYGDKATLLARVLSRLGCEISDSLGAMGSDDFALLGISPKGDETHIGATRHIISSLAVAGPYLEKLDTGDFPLLYNPPGKRNSGATVELLNSEAALRWCEKYFTKTSKLLCLEQPLPAEKSWRVLIVDAEVIACYECRLERTSGTQEYLKVEPLVAAELAQVINDNLPRHFQKGVYGVDVVTGVDGDHRLAAIKRRPAFGDLRRLYNLNFPALVHSRLSQRVLPCRNTCDETVGASVLFLGDTNPGETYQLRNEEKGEVNILTTHGYDQAFLPFRSLLDSADYRIMNFEAVITSERESPFREIKPYLDWTSPEETPRVMRELSIDAVNLANNHSLDYGETGLREMLKVLDESGIAHFGAAMDASAAAHPLQYVLQVGEREQRIIVASGFEHRGNHDQWGYYARTDKAGVNDWTVANAGQQVGELRVTYPDAFIVAFPHWGSNYSYKVERQERLAHVLIDAGADLIIGHGSHMMQEIERYSNRWVVYGIGNFVYNAPGRFHKFDVLPYGLIPRLRFLAQHDQCSVELELYPIFSDNRVSDYNPRYLNARELKNLLRRFTLHSDDDDNELIRRVVMGHNQFGPYFSLQVASHPWD
ncbi:MAG: CapA family protein [Proteobacteria bacterium]|nr:CapA family protein [Pseudomonadota bacterium]MBU1647806.1 CapA family protein [Pseudomonadota bacterium]